MLVSESCKVEPDDCGQFPAEDAIVVLYANILGGKHR